MVKNLNACAGQLHESFTLSCLSGLKVDTKEQGKEAAPSSGDGFICGSSEPNVTPLMKTTARAVAENYLQKGAPIKAACTLLAINDVQVCRIHAIKCVFHIILKGDQAGLIP
jgi:hypothetical protein